MTEAVCRLADWDSEREALMSVRHRVFVEEQRVPEELEWDEHDNSASHFVVTEHGNIIATGRLKRNGQVGRMAVLPEYRGRGVGSLLLRTIIQHAAHAGLDKLYLHAQLQAIGFYERHGFVAQGEEFLDAGIAHRAMTRECAT